LSLAPVFFIKDEKSSLLFIFYIMPSFNTSIRFELLIPSLFLNSA
jgi:hypothetical protein